MKGGPCRTPSTSASHSPAVATAPCSSASEVSGVSTSRVWLAKLDTVTTVSGGSILNGVLATPWARLHWADSPEGRITVNFCDEVAAPVCALASCKIDVFAHARGYCHRVVRGWNRDEP